MNGTGKAHRPNVENRVRSVFVKRQNMGGEVVLAITDGKLDFGPWKQIFYGEFDGRRNNRVKVIGE